MSSITSTAVVARVAAVNRKVALAAASVIVSVSKTGAEPAAVATVEPSVANLRTSPTVSPASSKSVISSLLAVTILPSPL